MKIGPYRVFLPRGYDEHLDRYYPVVYVLGGQQFLEDDVTQLGTLARPATALDPDGVTISSTIASGQMNECIFVGVDSINFGDNTPFNQPFLSNGEAGYFSEQADFIRLELMPAINESYRVLGGAQNTAAMGADTMGNVALFLAYQFPDLFGKVAAFTIQSNANLFNIVVNDPKKGIRIGLGANNQSISGSFQLRNRLVDRAPESYVVGQDILLSKEPLIADPGESLRSNLPSVLSFLFPTGRAQESSGSNRAVPYFLSFYGLTQADWELDADGDGWTTRQEYHFGTSPVDSSSFPKYSSGVDSNSFLLSIESRPAVFYRLDRSSNLLDWSPSSSSFVGTGQSFDIEILFDFENKSREFLRFNVPPPIDSDRDGLDDVEEAILLGTKTSVADTDLDGVTDGDEVLFRNTDPLVPNFAGGSISGSVLSDLDGDGDLTGATAIPNATVYLDLNYNARLDPNEPTTSTDSTGAYLLQNIAAGSYHLRQIVPPGNVQTFPAATLGQPDSLADRIVEFTHVPNSVYDVLHGRLATSTTGSGTSPSSPIMPVEPELLLKPIGARESVFSTVSEWAILTKNSSVTFAFDDEEIIDGPGFDFQVITLDSREFAGETFEISAGTSLDQVKVLTQVSEYGRLGFDIGRYDLTEPIRFVKVKSLSNVGSLPGVELVGITAINFTPRSPDVHFVTVVSGETSAGFDFGRFGQDLLPKVFISQDGTHPLAGGSLTIEVSANDDFGVTSLSLTANGNPITLDNNNRATIPTPRPGPIELIATATDSAGHVGTAQTNAFVFNSDGSRPDNPDSPGISNRNLNAPIIAIQSPAVGQSLDLDAPVVASISAKDPVTSWSVHYAPVDLIDPYDLEAVDADYILLGTGTGPLTNEVTGTIPASTLSNGIYFIRITATSTASPSESTTAHFGQVFAVRTDASELYPSITLTSPEPGATVPFLVDVVGSISSVSPLREWYVERADISGLTVLNTPDAAGATFTRIAEGTGPITDDVLATFDPSTLKNGTYLIKVTAFNEIGLGFNEGIQVNVCGENKPGRLRREFTDLNIDLAGIPLTITRTYDSLEKDRSGDFGFGWSFGLVDADIRDTDPDNGAIFSGNAWKRGTRIYLNSPKGKRIGFTFDIELVRSGRIASFSKGVFTPDPGVYETLELLQRDTAFLTSTASGDIAISGFGLPFNPDDFILTTRDGTEYTYNENQGLLGVEDMRGNTLVFTRDAIRHSSGAQVTIARDAQDHITSITGPDDEIWTYNYGPTGDLVQVTDPATNLTTLTYTAGHFLASVIDPLGRAGTSYEFDADGRLSAIIDEDGNRSEQNWDLTGFSGSISDLRGNVTTIRYDELGNVIREELPDGGVIQYEYSDPANPELETAVIDQLGHETNYQYDRNGNITRESPALGQATTRVFNEMSMPVEIRTPSATQTYTYGDQGELLETNNRLIGTMRYVHTADGRISSATDYAGNISEFTYNGRFSKLSKLANQKGESTSTSYFGNGLIETVEGNFGSQSFTYDRAGRPLTETDAEGNVITYSWNGDQPDMVVGETGVTTSFNYNAAGDLLDQSINGETGRYTYDADGNRTSVTDAIGNVTTNTYDMMGNLLTVTDPAGAVTTHTYDMVGNRISTIDRLGRKRTFEYNAARNRTAENWHDPADDSVFYSILYTYNFAQRLSSVTDGTFTIATQQEVTLGEENAPTSETYTFPGISPQTVRYFYQNGTQLTQMRLGTSSFHTISRDVAGIPTILNFSAPADGSARIDLLNHHGKRPRQVKRYSSFQARESDLFSTSDFTYNHRGRRESITHQDHASYRYTHNAAGQVDSISESAGIVNYSYNARGEIASGFSFGPGANPTAATLSSGNRIEILGDFQYDWDGEGNLIQKRNTVSGEVSDYTWDFRNRLTRVEIRPSAGAGAAVDVSYQYDHEDLMIGRTENGSTTWTINDINRMPFVEFTDSDPTPSAIYYYHPDRPDQFLGEWRAGRGYRWYLTDQLGSVREVIDNDGNLTSTFDYDAFGNLTASTGENIMIGHAGRPRDPSTGLTYSRARHYDPQLGRFISEDPIGFASGEFNLYRYAKNDPLNYVDPSGNLSLLEYASNAVGIEDLICTFGKVGIALDQCFRQIASAIENPISGSVPKSCTENQPLSLYPIPGFGSTTGGGSGGVPAPAPTCSQ